MHDFVTLASRRDISKIKDRRGRRRYIKVTEILIFSSLPVGGSLGATL